MQNVFFPAMVFARSKRSSSVFQIISGRR
jgi:hypothetical protein